MRTMQKVTNLNVKAALDSLDASYAAQNERDEHKMFLAGLRKGRNKKGCKALNCLVAGYDKFLLDQKSKAANDRNRRAVFQQFKKECLDAVEKVRKSKRYATTKLPWKVNITGYHPSTFPTRKRSKKLRFFRRKIASAAGFQELQALA